VSKTLKKDLFSAKQYSPITGAGFDDVDSSKGGKQWKFTTPAIDAINTKFMAVKKEFDAQQASIVRELIAVASEYSDVLAAVSSRVAELDCVMSMAEASVLHGYVRPNMLPMASDPSWNFLPGAGQPESTLASGVGVAKRAIRLIGARHPCLDAQDDCEFVPNDVVLEHDETRFVLITGPNMGGKSTYIRTVGVCCLMAQIGCFVPCDSAEMCVVDGIFCRVGASDSQLRGVSTFMAEMLEMSGVLQSATQDSLLIVDELGRGTSTYDGFGLAWAISEHVCREIGCWALFATHFHELTQLEESIPFVGNLHVDAVVENDELVLLHQVRPGPSLQSFGIRVAELANFPPEVVQSARAKLEELDATAIATSTTTTESDADASRAVSIGPSANATSATARDRATGARVVQRFLEKLREQVSQTETQTESDQLDDETVVRLVQNARASLGTGNLDRAVAFLRQELV
jgi:DNA mismatch repair protein MSH2